MAAAKAQSGDKDAAVRMLAETVKFPVPSVRSFTPAWGIAPKRSAAWSRVSLITTVRMSLGLRFIQNGIRSGEIHVSKR
jgi:hypothetical protein